MGFQKYSPSFQKYSPTQRTRPAPAAPHGRPPKTCHCPSLGSRVGAGPAPLLGATREARRDVDAVEAALAPVVLKILPRHASRVLEGLVLALLVLPAVQR